MTVQRATRGDLIVIEHSSTGTRGAYSTTVNVGYRVGRVVGVRDGVVLSADVVSIGGLARVKLNGTGGYGRTWVQPKTTVDVGEAIAIAKAHHYPGHPRQPKDFASLDDVKRALRPARR